jgi:hypothetical protein
MWLIDGRKRLPTPSTSLVQRHRDSQQKLLAGYLLFPAQMPF